MIVKKTKKLVLTVFATVLFCGYNLTVQAVTVEFETITEALNYSGDKSTVTKLVITGEIAGDDYSENSEWSKFRTLDETFPNIEAVEILTSQDIPDGDFFSLFSYLPMIGFPKGANWLKSFSAPNVKYVGSWAFSFCENLVSVKFPLLTTIGDGGFHCCFNLYSVDFPFLTTIGKGAFRNCYSLISVEFPVATTIGEWAFCYCTSLISANFPVVETVGDYAFYACNTLLTSLSFGTGFTVPTEIKFGENVFSKVYVNDILTEKIYLTLGENVLPIPDLVANTWQCNMGDGTGTPYVWKSIDYTSILETVKNLQVSISPNPTSNSATVNFDLETAGHLTVTLTNILGQELFEIYSGFANAGTFTKTFSMEALPVGVYYLRILHNGNVTVEKVVRE